MGGTDSWFSGGKPSAESQQAKTGQGIVKCKWCGYTENRQQNNQFKCPQCGGTTE